MAKVNGEITLEPGPGRRYCGTMEVHRRLLTEVPSYAVERDRIENLCYALEKGLRRVAPREVITIPVVVHVVANTDEQDISDDQIHTQLQVLNEDFRSTNSDVKQVPDVWSALVADTKLEFQLAGRDPDGNPTSGITRTRSTVASFSDDNAVKSTARGGIDPWPTDRYLNMWVCPLGNGLLGYAQFPGGPAATDGVVITHTAFGTSGTATAPFNLGRTTTHEIGHWLGLRHIWGDDGGGCSSSDYVEDTPNQGGPNYGTPQFPTPSCNNDPNGDMFMNFMDYVDDQSMVMFTQGQLTRVNASLEAGRESFVAQSQ